MVERIGVAGHRGLQRRLEHQRELLEARVGALLRGQVQAGQGEGQHAGLRMLQPEGLADQTFGAGAAPGEWAVVRAVVALVRPCRAGTQAGQCQRAAGAFQDAASLHIVSWKVKAAACARHAMRR